MPSRTIIPPYSRLQTPSPTRLQDQIEQFRQGLIGGVADSLVSVVTVPANSVPNQTSIDFTVRNPLPTGRKVTGIFPGAAQGARYHLSLAPTQPANIAQVALVASALNGDLIGPKPVSVPVIWY